MGVVADIDTSYAKLVSMSAATDKTFRDCSNLVQCLSPTMQATPSLYQCLQQPTKPSDIVPTLFNVCHQQCELRQACINVCSNRQKLQILFQRCSMSVTNNASYAKLVSMYQVAGDRH